MDEGEDEAEKDKHSPPGLTNFQIKTKVKKWKILLSFPDL